MVSAKTNGNTSASAHTGSALSLSALFATPTTGALLSIFALYPEQVFIQRELVEMVAGNLYLVQRDLKRLERSGLVLRRPWGRQVQYRFDVTQPAATYLLAALLESIALRQPLAKALSEVDGIDLAFVFGPFVEGRGRTGDALDVAVACSSGCKGAVTEALTALSRALGCAIRVGFSVRRATVTGVAQPDPLVTAQVLEARKLWVIGDDDSLERWLARYRAFGAEQTE